MSFFAGLHQYGDWALLALRLGVGSIFLVHGFKKWPMWKMEPSAQLPVGLLRIVRLLSIAEPLGGIATLVGFLTQPAAFGFVLIMLGATRLKIVQMKKDFYGDGGWEFEYLLLLAAAALFILGAGAFSLDRLWFGL